MLRPSAKIATSRTLASSGSRTRASARDRPCARACATSNAAGPLSRLATHTPSSWSISRSLPNAIHPQPRKFCATSRPTCCPKCGDSDLPAAPRGRLIPSAGESRSISRRHALGGAPARSLATNEPHDPRSRWRAPGDRAFGTFSRGTNSPRRAERAARLVAPVEYKDLTKAYHNEKYLMKGSTATAF